MEQKVERKPLLSDEVIATGGDLDNPRAMTAWNVRAYYEGLLDRGELVIPKTAKESDIEYLKGAGQVGDYVMPCCGHTFNSYKEYPPEIGEHCRCGARIID